MCCWCYWDCHHLVGCRNIFAYSKQSCICGLDIFPPKSPRDIFGQLSTLVQQSWTFVLGLAGYDSNNSIRYVLYLLMHVVSGLSDQTTLVLALAWVSATTAGHTKKVTMNAVMLSGYCIGNAVGPFMWQQKYKPRNHVPWIGNIFFSLSIIALVNFFEQLSEFATFCLSYCF